MEQGTSGRKYPYTLTASTGPWTLINANPGWSVRHTHSTVVMPVDGSIVLMGGQGQGLFNDVWRSTDNGVTWTQIVTHAPWTDRSHFTAVALQDNSIVLMGGRDGSGYRNDVWRSTNNGTTWTQMTANAGWSPRMCPTSVVLSNNSIVLMGGTGSSGSTNDSWLSQDFGATWTLRSSSPGWRARYVHSSVALPGDNILLLGGYNFGYTWYNDTWLSADKGATWSLLTMNAEWPARFTPVSTVMPDGSIMLMGGYGGYLMNDTWRSIDNGTTWNLINQSSGWLVRYSHQAVTTHDGNVVLTGGVDYSVPYHDVWRYVPPEPVQTQFRVYTEAGEPGEIYTIAKGFWDQMIIAENGDIEWNDWQSESDIISATDSRESHWNSTSDASDWVENADFAYFSGHGNPNLISFQNYDEGSGLNYTTASSMRLGSGRLKWAVLDSCESLNYTRWTNWQQSFTGLHILIGMNTSTVPSFDGSSRGRGEVFAKLMKGDYYPINTTRLKIIDAWDWAGKHTWSEEPGHSSFDVFTGVVYDTNCLNDYLPGWGSSCSAPSGTQGYCSTLVFAQYRSMRNSDAGYRSMELNNGKYTLSGSVPAKETITIYSSKKPDYYENWADSLAKNLGIPGKTSETANAFYADGSDADNYYFVVQKDAPVISFQKFGARSGFPQSRDESVSAANTFLTENGLMSSEALEPGVTYNSGESVSKSGKRTVDWRTAVVTYSRELDGLPVWNSQKMVELDSQGNVIGYFQNWRDYQSYKELKLKSLEKAFNEFQERQDKSDTAKADKIVVNNVQLGYFSQPAVATERFLQPIYVFEGYRRYGDSAEPFTPVTISAIDEVFDEIS